MEVWSDPEIHVMGLGFSELTMDLVECYGEYQVRCEQFPELEEVDLSRAREEASQQFIDYFFACLEMLR